MYLKANLVTVSCRIERSSVVAIEYKVIIDITYY